MIESFYVEELKGEPHTSQTWEDVPMSLKVDLIKPYFRRWRQDLARARKLLDTNEYYCEAILILSCYIGALAALRFPGRNDRDAYQRIVIRYSGLRSLYEKIDLLFFYQWPRSAYRRSHSPESRPYSRIKNYTQVKRAIVKAFGDEAAVISNPRQRYRSIRALAKCAPPGIGPARVRKMLRLFSVSEILYRFVRCHAVHERSFPLVRKVRSSGGTTRYEDQHLITGSVIFNTVSNIVNNLEVECLSKRKLPGEMRNR